MSCHEDFVFHLQSLFWRGGRTKHRRYRVDRRWHILIKNHNLGLSYSEVICHCNSQKRNFHPYILLKPHTCIEDKDHIPYILSIPVPESFAHEICGCELFIMYQIVIRLVGFPKIVSFNHQHVAVF